MKRFLLFWTILSIILVAPAQKRNASNNSGANEHSQIARETHVTPAQALNVGYTFMRTGEGSRGNGTKSDDVRKQVMQLVYTGQAYDSLTGTTTDCYYVFALQPKGFVIVAADDRVEPILGYSYDNNFVVADMPDHVRGWLGNYERQIEAVVKSNLQAEPATQTKWARLKAGQSMSSAKSGGSSVGPLLTTQWGQGWPYNAMCPIDSLAGESYHYHCPTGCVATAFAQVMNYWKYPERGNGKYGNIWYNETTYQWDSMDVNHIDEISKLMYHIGVGADMAYGPTSSSANSEIAKIQIVNFFEYEYTDEEVRSNHSDDSWTALLDSLLEDSIPVVYSGITEDFLAVGHAWVCDGYDANGFYHMNWGWDGVMDGYFGVNSSLNGFDNRQTINYIYPANYPITSGFIYDQSSINPKLFQFIDYSYGFPDSFYWDFGDGCSSIEMNPIHQYADVGVYPITLIVCKDNQCDTAISHVSIYLPAFSWNGDTLSPHDGESQPLVIDYDMDGKQDFIISSNSYDLLTGSPSGWVPYVSNPTTIYRNVDSTFEATQIQHSSSLPPIVIDISNDNKPSVLLDGLYLHNVNGVLTTDTIITLAQAMKKKEKFSVVDYNNDGRMDVMIGDTLYKNIGGGLFTPNCNLPFGKIWFDYDKDGDMDLFTSQGMKSSLYQNNGDGTFHIQPIVGNYSWPSPRLDSVSGRWFDGSDYGDVDGNGWLDIVGSNSASNLGNNHFVIGRNTYANICADFTLDGQMDILDVGVGILENANSFLTYYPNFGIFGNTPASLAFIDRDDDNRPDLLATGFCNYEGFYGNTTIVYDNASNSDNLPPTAPAGLNASVSGNNVILSWQPSTDDHNSVAITYNIAIGTSPNTCDVYSPLSNLETGKRYAYNKGNAGNATLWKVNDLPNGTYYWRVQAIDNALAASAFSTVGTFTINHENLPPSMADFSKAGFVNQSLAFGLENFTNYYSDPEHDSLQSVKICNMQGDGTLYLAGATVSDGQIIPATSLASLFFASSQPGVFEIALLPNDGYHFSNDTTHIRISTVLFKQSQTLVADNISALAWGDFDNDGDADWASNTGIWKNDSGTFVQVYTPTVESSTVQWVDVNNDGLLDCLFDMTICLNQGSGVFSQQPSLATSIGMKASSTDLNTDNHPDIVISADQTSTVFLNFSDGYSSDSVQTFASSSSIGSIAVGDYDRDGDEDVIMVEEATWNVQLLKNNDGTLINAETQISNYNCGSSDWGDYDRDGDLDFIGTMDNTGLKIYSNDGLGYFYEVFTGQLPIVYGGFVKWYDYDNDGYLDILMGGLGSDDAPVSFLFKNNQGLEFVKVDKTNLPLLSNPNCAIGDYDHDGYGDIVISGTDESGETHIFIYHNNMGCANPMLQTQSSPQGLTATVSGSTVHLSWNDSIEGNSYNVYVRKATDSIYIVSPLSNTQTGERMVAKMGNAGLMKSLDIRSLQEGSYLWSVQSVDATYHGSPFASEQSFEIVCAEPIYTDIYDTVHAVYAWHGSYYNSTGIYSRTFESSSGCDSIVRLHLTVDSLEKGIVYVTQSGSGDKSGYSWDNAMDDLQMAINTSANRNAVVWVAEGIYTNESGGQAAFVIPNTADVLVYGGFEGAEPADYDLTLRNLRQHETILDGLNRMVVIFKEGGESNTVVDGFTIQNGYGECGGGIYVAATGDYPFTAINCCIKDNMSSFFGGGFCGIDSWFGAAHDHQNTMAYAINCLIYNNRSWKEGAVSSVTLINSTIVNNIADSDNGFGQATCYNSIIWGNVSPVIGTSFASQVFSSAVQSYLLGNIDEHSFYLDANNNDGNDTNTHYVRFVDPENGDFRLSTGSACINKGTMDTTGPGLPTVDLQGNPRVMDARIDMGAYEFDPALSIYYTITALPSLETGGTIANSGVYTYGQICTLTASANDGYTFLYWSENDSIISENPICSFMVTQDRNLTAVFVEEGSLCGLVFELSGWYPTNSLVVEYGDGTSEHLSTSFGEISYKSFTRYVNSGNNISLGFSPGILSWECVLNIYNADGNQLLSFSNLDENFHYGFTYYCDGTLTHTITTTSNPEIGGNVIGAGTYLHDATATLTAIPYDGFIFTHWNDEETDNPRTVTLSNNMDFIAYFTPCTDTSEFAETVCGDYEWNGETFTTSGDYTQTLINATGCDSVVTLHLTINQPTTGTDVQTACGSFTWIDGITYTESNNTATYTLTNAAGCDSVVTLNLTVNQPTTGTDVQTACGSFTWIDGITYTESNNTATYTLTNAAGCDSVVTLNLTVNQPTTGDTTAVACESYTWYGSTYTESGSYLSYQTNAAGCDSVVTLHLTINQPTTGTDVQTACGSYTWIDGITYTESNNTATYTLTNAAGCDSVVTLNLTVNQPTTGTDVQTACGSYTWIDGITYTESNNTATYTLTNATGCDSVVTLHLTVYHGTHNSETVVECDNYEWHEETYTTSGMYLHEYMNGNGCPSADTLHLILYENATSEFAIFTEDSCYLWNFESYCTSGDYTQTLQTVHGCDSVVTLHLTITVGIDDHNLAASMTVYPNPTSGIVNVQCTMNNVQVETMEILVYDAFGRLLRSTDGVETQNFASLQTGTHGSSVQTQIDLSRYAPGVYLVKAVADGNVVAVRKIVKN